MFFDYDYNGEQKHSMVVAHLTDEDGYKINILYEDNEGGNITCVITSNLSDFFSGENDDIKKLLELKKKFIKILSEYCEKEYTSIKLTVPNHIRNTIVNKIIIY